MPSCCPVWRVTGLVPIAFLVDLAYTLSEKGVTVLRADPLGTGYSDGRPEDQTFETLVRDTRDLAHYLIKATGANKVLLGGICRGARVALATALDEPSVQSLLLLSCAPITPATIAAATSRRRLHHAWQYLRKALSASHIHRLLTGDVRLSLVFKALLQPVPGQRLKPELNSGHGTALMDVAARTLFLYGETDPDRDASIAYWHNRASHASDVTFHTISGADHGFYAVRWHRAVLAAVENWWKAQSQ